MVTEHRAGEEREKEIEDIPSPLKIGPFLWSNYRNRLGYKSHFVTKQISVYLLCEIDQLFSFEDTIPTLCIIYEHEQILKFYNLHLQS